MLIGREKETALLTALAEKEESQLVAIYGRRRVGKTYLIRETLKDRFTFQHAGIYHGTRKEQLYAFYQALKDAGLSGENTVPKNWFEAFQLLKMLVQQSTRPRKILFIDELSWMDTPRTDLIRALEHFWNAWASARNDVVLIVCSSATSWILNKIIHNKGGLYNRLTGQIKLEPFTLAQCREYVAQRRLAFSDTQIMELYMAVGGIPYYWGLMKKGLSVAQNIDELFFAENAPLAQEYEYLFASIFSKPEDYQKIIRALAVKKKGLTRNEILKATGLTGSGVFSQKLEELESCGFIRRYNAFGMKKKNSVYQLMDCFTLFYYRFLEENPSDEQFWTNQINMPKVNTWMGLAFERVCLMHVKQMKHKLGISGVLTEVNSWYCKADPEKGIFGSQIDLLLVRKDQVINLCEMKYSNTEYTITEKTDRSIRHKISDLIISTGTRYAIYPTLVTTYGITDNAWSSNMQSVITVDDLFV